MRPGISGIGASEWAYRQWLRVLPRPVRDRYSEDMSDVFAALAADARRESGFVGLAVLWMKEIRGLFSFAVRDRRDRAAAASQATPSRGPRFGSEVRWAWRAVRARRGRAALIVGLLAVTLAANTLFFTVADALVFHRVSFANPDQLVEIQYSRRPGAPGDSLMSASLLEQWQKQTDIFQSVNAYLTKTVFLTDAGQTDLVPASDVTPGLIDMLGVRPRWGRSFVAGDAHETDPIPALLSEALARKRFGDPALAVGRRIETTAQALVVVGVMPDEFRFPYSSTGLWRAMDPRGPLTANFAGVSSLARMTAGLSIDVLKAAMAQKSPAIGAAAGKTTTYLAFPGEFRSAHAGKDQRRLSLTLLGAALCLLLIACANVASLELTSAMARTRTHAIQLALGASRGALARMALIEGAWIVGAATAIAAGLSWLGAGTLTAFLPPRIGSGTLRPFVFDWRAFAFMTAAAAVTWLIVALPLVVHASRAGLSTLLKTDARSSSLSRAGVAVRRMLTIVEVALAVVLLVGGLLYLRTYRALIGIDKGFDSANVVEIGAAIPPQALGQRSFLAQQMIERVKSMPGVLDAVDELPPPSFNSPTGDVKVSVDSEAPRDESIMLSYQPVDPAYFAVLRMPLKNGRFFERYEDQAHVVVTESFARRYWPGQDAVGHHFKTDDRRGLATVIGVVGDIRSDGDVPGRDQGPEPWLMVFVARPAPVAPKPMTSDQIRSAATGGMYGLLGIMVRLDSMDRADAVLQAARTVDPRLRLTLTSIDDTYAKAFATTEFAARTVGGFALLAFAVSMAGIYGVMAFLVAGRTKEIGIRMALGAARDQVRRSVLASSAWLVIAGAGIGVAAALGFSRWIESEMYGITATDAATYAVVSAAVIVTALAATWQPARQASRVDPAITLRTE